MLLCKKFFPPLLSPRTATAREKVRTEEERMSCRIPPPLLSSFPCFNICLYVPQEQKVFHFHSLDPPGARALRRFFSLEKVKQCLGYKSNKRIKIFFLQKFRCLSCLISLSKWSPSPPRVPWMHNSIIDRDFLHLS